MTPSSPQQIRLALDRWLSQVGFAKGNPFSINEAESEPFLPECFVDPGVYDILVDSPHPVLVFAPRGGGKTALRVMLAYDCRPLQPDTVNPRSQCLAVMYSDFDSVLSTCDYDLTRLTPAHHVARILHDACSALLDSLWQDNQLMEMLSPPDRSLFASYCRHYTPALLSADATYRRLKSVCPQVDVSWSALRQAVTERRLGSFLQGRDMPLTPALGLYAELVDDTPEPLTDTDSVVGLLSGFTQLAQRVGLQRVYILIDGLDERLITFQDPHKLAALIAPLISNLPLMGIPGVAFRLFLPREAREAVLPFVRRDRYLEVLDVTWGNEQLRELLRLRLQFYSGDKIKTLRKLCQEPLASRIEDEMIEFADGSPRRLLQLGAVLLEMHAPLSPTEHKITEAAWIQTLSKVFGEHYVRPLWVDRQTAQVYLGRTTPVRLASIPYRLVVYLYDTKGFCTTQQIADAVWEGWATGDQIRQTIKRIRVALKEAGADPDHYLINEPGRGYRLQNTA